MNRFAGPASAWLAALAIAGSAVAILPAPIPLLTFAVIAAIFVAPGWPLARWLVGDDADRLTRTLMALPLGYLCGATIFCALRWLGAATFGGVLLISAAGALALAWVLRSRQPGVIECVRFGGADRIAVGLLCLLAMAIVGPVFARAGEPTPLGLAYHAYFNADLFVHMSVVAELAKGATPPLNPYFPVEAFPYYWTYFTLPALFSHFQPDVWVDRGVLLTDVAVAATFLGVGHVLLRNLGVSALASVVAWCVVMLASSFEGAYFLWQQISRGLPLDDFRITNVDAITRWYWTLPGVDGLHRAMWWTPQHLTALTLFLIALLTAVRARRPNDLRTGAFEGLLLGGIFVTSSLNGVMLVAWYGATQTLLLAVHRGREIGRWVLARGVAAAVVLLFWGLSTGLGMIQMIPNAFLIGWNRYFLRGPWTFLWLSFGPAFFLAPFGIAAAARASKRLIVALAALVAVAAVAFLQVDLRGHENTQVTFRTGQLFYLCLVVLLGFAIDTWRRWRRPAAAIAFAALTIGGLAGVPTVALDWYNARDISNLEMNPGNFPWTLHINPSDQAAAEWIHRFVPETATVQTDALVRERNAWAFITGFAERRMGTGNGLFTLNPARYEPNLRAIHDAFSKMSPEEAHATFVRVGADYLYVGDVERQINGDSVRKFGTRLDLFQPLYRRGSVEIFKILK